MIDVENLIAHPLARRTQKKRPHIAPSHPYVPRSPVRGATGTQGYPSEETSDGSNSDGCALRPPGGASEFTRVRRCLIRRRRRRRRRRLRRLRLKTNITIV